MPARRTSFSDLERRLTAAPFTALRPALFPALQLFTATLLSGASSLVGSKSCCWAPFMSSPFWVDLILFEDRLSNQDGTHRLTAVVGTCVLASRSHPFKDVLECSSLV